MDGSTTPIILCVDDDSYLIDLLRYALTREGYSVQVAARASEALQIVEMDPPHIVLLDVNLPDMNGYELCARLHRSSSIPVIMLTARGTDEDALAGFSQGAEVQMGAYHTSRGRATVLAIAYPTPQIARARYATMEKILALNQDHGAGSLYGTRLASYIILVPDSDSATIAKILLNLFSVSERVVKNERYPGDKSIAVQMMELIVANLIFVFVLSGIAIGGGVIIFLSRRFAQKWFPETQWGQQDARTIITLNLN